MSEPLYLELMRRVKVASASVQETLDKPRLEEEERRAKAAKEAEAIRAYNERRARQKADTEATKPREELYGLSQREADEIIARREATKGANASGRCDG